LLALHCAIAKHALIIELPIIPDSLYKLLHDIEIHQKEKPEERNNNVAVLRKLRKLGKQFSSLISDEQMKLIKSANQITVYSDFPIGLAIFDDDDISLHSYKKVTYHSLSPLINSLQFELPTIFEIDFTKKIKVLFAECVIDNQNNGFIRKCSKKLLDHLKSLYKNEGKIEVAYRETLSVASLMSFIRDNPDADVLYISAHGFYSPQRNMAGLSIGNEDWLAEEHFKVPPLVILSACHTTPRGAGCISVSDMLLRWGAVAVLGTYIPIKAQRNIYLMARFFSSISRALCHVSSCKDLLECWNDNTVTNIIMEFIAETPGFRKWMYGQNGDGTIRLNEFERRLTSRRWLAGNAYKTACEIIYEMLNEEGQSGRFANLLSRQDYFPEMSFYQWEGMPESIILQNTDIDNSIIK